MSCPEVARRRAGGAERRAAAALRDFEEVDGRGWEVDTRPRACGLARMGCWASNSSSLDSKSSFGSEVSGSDSTAGAGAAGAVARTTGWTEFLVDVVGVG